MTVAAPVRARSTPRAWPSHPRAALLGNVLFALVVATVAGLLATRWALNVTADNLRAASQRPAGTPLPIPANAAVVGLIDLFGADVWAGTSATALDRRAVLLNRRGDRLGEMAGALATAGVFLTFVLPSTVGRGATGNEPPTVSDRDGHASD